MSNIAKVVVVIVVLVLLGYFMFGGKSSVAPETAPVAEGEQALVSADTSNAGLEADLNNLDAELQGAASDSAAVDASLSGANGSAAIQ